MKKAYIQPEFDLFNILATEDILTGSVENGTGEGWGGVGGNGDYGEDDDGWGN